MNMKVTELIKNVLDKFGVEYKLIPLPEDLPIDIESHAAFHRIGLDQAMATILYNTDKGLIAVVKRADTQIDQDKLKKLAGVKKMIFATKDELENLGAEAGMVPFLGLDIPFFIDKRILEVEKIFGTGGSKVLGMSMNSKDLEKVNHGLVGDITKTGSVNKIVFSGIQPSGDLHIGNYIGAVRQWASGQDEGLNIFCIVDLHAITVPQDPKTLAVKTREITTILLAAGIDPEKSLLFIQSHNPDHANLGWVLNCYLSMGQLSRMTQYKEKSEGKESVSVGLFDYPALMAADILLYDTTEVPVGEDQKQHVELTRDVAEKFNSKYGQTFVLPEPKVPRVGGRVMSLSDPLKKMSKSDVNANGAILLLESPESARKKIMAAVTDSGNEVKLDWVNKPGISNLLEIYSQISGQDYLGSNNYGEFKSVVADVVEKFLIEFQQKYKAISESGKLESILATGAKKSYEISHPKLIEIYKKIGFLA